MKEERICQNCKLTFLIEDEDFQFYKKIDVPPPTFCPECRFQRRLNFRNERNLYKRPCGLCEKIMITTFSPDNPRIAYCQECWWSDKWDPADYGRSYDPSKTFFEQLNELFNEVPLPALGNNYPTLVNSEYVNESGSVKDSYLTFDADFCENTMYGTRLTHIKDSSDLYMSRDAELEYEDVACYRSSRIFFSEDCADCVNIYFSKNMVNCQDCFGCAGLRNKQYYLWNQPLTKEVYNEKLEAFKKSMKTRMGVSALWEEALVIWNSVPYKFFHGLGNNKVTGDYLYHSKNAKDSFQCQGLEDGRFCQLIKDGSVKDAYDYTIWGANVHMIYDCINVGENTANAKFNFVVALGNTMNAEYSMWSLNVANIFGCSGIRGKKYYILNKEYSKEEYELLRSQIIADMQKNPYVDKKGRVYGYGEFFPYELSSYAYNETSAMEYFPVTEEEAEARGWRWRKESRSEHAITMKAGDIPESIDDIPDSIINEVIECAMCQRGYRIVSAELKILKRFSFPVPQMCSECRHKRRFERINPMKLWKRTCQCAGEKSENGIYTNTAKHHHEGKCSNEFETSYAPERKEIVYCEKCYQSEIN
ncbi:MAG: hypothetical protein AB1333_01860 [Patescibacteria group bacterium]